MTGFRLAVCAEMVFLDLPFAERVTRIAELGFEVEMWSWADKDIDALIRAGVTVSSMTGYLTGTLTDPAGADELLRTAEQSLRIAERLDCPRGCDSSCPHCVLDFDQRFEAGVLAASNRRSTSDTSRDRPFGR